VKGEGHTALKTHLQKARNIDVCSWVFPASRPTLLTAGFSALGVFRSQPVPMWFMALWGVLASSNLCFCSMLLRRNF